ncbi:MAG: hypothetical protein ACRD1T_07315 [Acidimicrobiia bacterium]
MSAQKRLVLKGDCRSPYISGNHLARILEVVPVMRTMASVGNS